MEVFMKKVASILFLGLFFPTILFAYQLRIVGPEQITHVRIKFALNLERLKKYGSTDNQAYDLKEALDDVEDWGRYQALYATSQYSEDYKLLSKKTRALKKSFEKRPNFTGKRGSTGTVEWYINESYIIVKAITILEQKLLSQEEIEKIEYDFYAQLSHNEKERDRRGTLCHLIGAPFSLLYPWGGLAHMIVSGICISQ
jgi:hypothetical protein